MFFFQLIHNIYIFAQMDVLYFSGIIWSIELINHSVAMSEIAHLLPTRRPKGKFIHSISKLISYKSTFPNGYCCPVSPLLWLCISRTYTGYKIQ